MVNSALPTLAALAFASFAGAAPAATQSDTVEVFSFAQWIEGIIANPDGDNLTPDEAVEAWRASIDQTSPVPDSGLLQKRYWCNTIPNTEAYVPDAVWCINDVARRGGAECRVDTVTVFCVHGRAQITGVRGGLNPTSSSCNDVARGAGYVMDHCTRADNMVQGAEYAHGNGNLLVWIRRPD
ncbi:uncharacterized protein CTRU02_201371 [Colletotrichum truncatum]|uniref:Uncharacterized protein n=1 Tax=Colletotrichum truncatum TaxID=5467 RepID=A0ACC3ZH36_COLTU|nr:uncharacterized protein CTRU02_08162 [Colletotrichum truncatum]KAF6790642.1 hypothetical protein CTRU02_08162 [Colletotrichum truncatum]